MKKILNTIMNTITDKVKKDTIIEYDLRDSYALIYDEAYGVAKKRKKLLKNPRTKTHTYLSVTIFRLLLILFLDILALIYLKSQGYTDIFYFIYYNQQYSLDIIGVICILMPLLYLVLAINIIMFIIRINIRRKKLVGSFKLSKEGLTDSTFKGIKILFEWERIKMVVIKKYSIIILTDTPIYFFVNKEIENKLIKSLKKYKKDIKIVRKDI